MHAVQGHKVSRHKHRHNKYLSSLLSPFPLSFTHLFISSLLRTFSFQGIAQVSINIFHLNESALGNADISTIAAQFLLDLVFIDLISLPPSAPPTLITRFNGSFQSVSFTAMFQVLCAPNFFGEDCNTVCENRNDSLGHFTCDPLTGERVCLEGYSDVEGNCTACVPSSGCCEFNYTMHGIVELKSMCSYVWGAQQR
jgi:hypothetical protein